ncbi:hypothetical protein [Burkholderia lata]|uniref:Uncharacterized protein n=1 Tax=Burkholderia lata (strain ATCC 17760 / DSM 23089 / LMG 22485 / NCIMB 9086 / R18194 / 383) TaxID=482957 RepID=A0A6P2GUL1_BURL3|nr:hypothetical protein [Burkholderia lata]VWB08196.1 hypothetical protein BLA6863_00205 [Burkholderia lata]
MAPTREEAVEVLDKYAAAHDLPSYTELLDALESVKGEHIRSGVAILIHTCLMKAGRLS